MNLDNIAAVKQQLRDGVMKGYWTMEQLDTPSPGFVNNTRVDRRTFGSGYEGIEFRNLLRDDPLPREAVQATPDPKDFAAVLAPSNTPAEAEPLPITLESDVFDLF
jgi:hypothetical protein